MREIKFRAWDKEQKIMRDVQLMDWSDWWVSTAHTWERGSGKTALKYGERNSFRNENTDRHILMQFTGLKIDKQEIYEHDVLMIIAEDENGREIGREKCVVDFDRQAFVFAKSLKHRGLTQDALFKLYNARYLKWELLGNIYENPELIANE